MHHLPDSPSQPGRAAPPASPPASRAPLTMRQLYARGLALLGGAIPVSVAAGASVWLVLALAAGVILVLVLATVHDGGWTRKPPQPRTREPRRLPPGDPADPP